MIIPDLPVTIQDKIQNFINQYDYLKKIEPIRDNIFEILDEKCIILYFPQENEENDGSLIQKSVNGKLTNFVHINTYKVIEKQVFTAAHELAHILNLHEHLYNSCNEYKNMFSKELEEAAMNYFAALVLMPTQIFQEKATDLFKEYEPKIIRFYVLLTQYRRPTDFEKEKIEESIKNYEKIEKTYFKIKKETKNLESIEKDEEIENIKRDFLNAMDDDFNTSLAISHIYELIKIANSELNKNDKDLNKLKNIENVLDECAVNILGLKFEEKEENKTDEKLLEYILNLRSQLRQNKNFELSDQIRDDLTKLGYEVNDKKSN